MKEEKKEFDGSTSARVNIVALSTLAGADKALARLEKRQQWLQAKRIDLETEYSATDDDAVMVRIMDADMTYRKELPLIEAQLAKLTAKRKKIVAERAVEAKAYQFDDED